MPEPQDVRVVSADLPFTAVLGIAFKWVFAVAIACVPLAGILFLLYFVWSLNH